MADASEKVQYKGSCACGEHYCSLEGSIFNLYNTQYTNLY